MPLWLCVSLLSPETSLGELSFPIDGSLIWERSSAPRVGHCHSAARGRSPQPAAPHRVEVGLFPVF